MTTDDECPSGPDPLPLANLSRDAELGTADHQPEPRVRRLKELFKGQLLSLLGLILALVSTVVSIAALLPAFRGQEVSEKQLELAEWTALKDYLDRCIEDFKAGLASEECKAASGLSLPPPPGFRTGNVDFYLDIDSDIAGIGRSIPLLVSLVFMIVSLLYPALRLVRYVSRMKGNIRSGDSGDYKSTPKTRQSRISTATSRSMPRPRKDRWKETSD